MGRDWKYLLSPGWGRTSELVGKVNERFGTNYAEEELALVTVTEVRVFRDAHERGMVG